MATRRVEKFNRTLGIVSATYSAITGLTTLVTETHYLVTGDLITIRFPRFPQILESIAVTVTNGTTFTVATPSNCIEADRAEIEISYYSAGQTGGQKALTLTNTTGATAVLQSYVIGTGGATYTVEASLDNVHWITDASGAQTHTGTSNHTLAITIAPAWVYIRLNPSVIGASTKLYANLAG